MKTRAPAILAVTFLVALAGIGMNCSRSDTPIQSSFSGEVGVWYWLQSVGGINNDTLILGSESFLRGLYFDSKRTVEFYEWDTSEVVIDPVFRVGYTIAWENVGAERRKVLRYEGDVHGPQTVEFMGRDTLILTDLLIDGYTHRYFRLYGD